VERRYREVRALRLDEGASELQMLILGRAPLEQGDGR
jgi:alkylation response protein AidB-like acyl-CoA dehydrogenase